VAKALEICSLDNSASVVISVIDTETQHVPSVGVSVTLRGDFAGSNPHVWYEQAALLGFVRGLKKVEARRDGQAALDSMSPGECVFCVRCVGLRGFILVQVRLSRIVHFHDAGQSENNQLIVTFEMDREMFHHLIADFGELAAQVKDDPFGQK
jgi:hypothetical protein